MADIIFADDDRNNRYVIAAHLQLRGHQVRLAANGQEALDLIHQQRPDVVLMDLMMPVLDGCEACRRLRQDPRDAALPVVALTALDLSDQDTVARDCRFDAVVSKPFRMEELYERIDTLLAAAA